MAFGRFSIIHPRGTFFLGVGCLGSFDRPPAQAPASWYLSRGDGKQANNCVHIISDTGPSHIAFYPVIPASSTVVCSYGFPIVPKLFVQPSPLPSHDVARPSI